RNGTGLSFRGGIPDPRAAERRRNVEQDVDVLCADPVVEVQRANVQLFRASEPGRAGTGVRIEAGALVRCTDDLEPPARRMNGVIAQAESRSDARARKTSRPIAGVEGELSHTERDGEDEPHPLFGRDA